MDTTQRCLTPTLRCQCGRRGPAGMPAIVRPEYFDPARLLLTETASHFLVLHSAYRATSFLTAGTCDNPMCTPSCARFLVPRQHFGVYEPAILAAAPRTKLQAAPNLRSFVQVDLLRHPCPVPICHKDKDVGECHHAKGVLRVKCRATRRRRLSCKRRGESKLCGILLSIGCGRTALPSGDRVGPTRGRLVLRPPEAAGPGPGRAQAGPVGLEPTGGAVRARRGSESIPPRRRGPAGARGE